jgi:hypothetical protein
MRMAQVSRRVQRRSTSSVEFGVIWKWLPPTFSKERWRRNSKRMGVVGDMSAALRDTLQRLVARKNAKLGDTMVRSTASIVEPSTIASSRIGTSSGDRDERGSS